MRILITGGAGFLGQYLVKACAEQGHGVTVMDLQPSRFPIHDIARYCRRCDYGIDITRPGTWNLEGYDVVFHLAGVVSFWRKARGSLNRVNVLGTRNVLAAALRAGVPRLIHISSVAAIGFSNAGRCVLDEDFAFDWTTVNHKPYMLSKHLAEEEVNWARQQGLNVVIVNPGLMWGPGDMTNSKQLIVAMMNRKVPACPPGGTNIVDVRDVARGLLTFVKRGRCGERYILGGANIRFQEVYRIIAKAIDVMPPRVTLPRFLKPLVYFACLVNEQCRGQAPALTADHVDSSFRFRYFSSAKAERELGWRARIPFEDTIRDSVDWLSSHGYLMQP